MKKIILISMITSGVLLAGTVTDLTTDIGNDINNGISSPINNANVSQGHTMVSGDSTVSDLNIIQKDLNNGAGNKIDSVAIDSATVNQGLTQINDGAVSDSTLNSNNTIYDSSITTGSEVNQASTIVNGGAEVENTTLTSTNTLSALVQNDSDVSQATVEVNGDDTSLDHGNLTSTNEILAGTVIDASEVHQARTRIGGGYTVSHLTMNETNTLYASVTGGSNVIQGGLDVCSHGADASDWCED